jgi:hypothetical protein
MPEIVALAVAALLLIIAVGGYLLLLRPQRARLESMSAERLRLEKQLNDMGTSVQQDQDAETSAHNIVESLVSFETEHLGDATQGSTRVIEELNRLIRKNSLRISGGLAFTQLQETAPGEARKQRTASSNEARVVESIFPGVAITMTVEGTYPSLRKFIRDVEADNRQFIVVNTVELEGIAESTSGLTAASSAPVVSSGEAGTVAAPAATAPASGMRGALVSLRLDMSAYFRRAKVAPAEPEQTSVQQTSR